jgi:DNA-binding transcriptional LysR family regulator
MSDFDVRHLNLNLLPALEALLVEGSVSGAARRMHVSQSAMSHSLARLREVFGDPLLISTGRRVAPTPLGERLAADLSRALDRLGDAIRLPQPFDPRTARRVFRLATVDYFELTVLPRLLSYLSAHAPLVDLEIERFSPAHVPALVAGEIDLALTGESAGLPTAGLSRRRLHAEGFSVMARREHPTIGRRLDLETYLSLGHVLVSVVGRRDGVVDRALAKLGRSRRVALRVPNFASAPLAVMASDHVCTIAAPVARRARELFGVRVLAPPLELPSAGIVALWSRRLDDDAASRWFRELFVADRAPLSMGARRRSRLSLGR